MDCAFAILNFMMGYYMLAKHFKGLKQIMKNVLKGIYVLFVLQTIISFVNLYMIFKFRGADIKTQVFIEDNCARNNDWLIFCVVMILFLQVLFRLKYVQIEMDERYDSVSLILSALKKYQRIERTVLAFYITNLLIFFALVVYNTISAYQIYHDKGFKRLPEQFFIAQTIFGSLRLLLDGTCLLYFIKMARSYYKILSLQISWPFFYGPMIVLSVLILLTLISTEVYSPIVWIFGKHVRNNR